MQIVTFYIKDKMYGVDIRLVNEANPNPSIFPVPLSGPYIRGLVNIRGQVVLVFDIAILFGYPKSPITDESHIIIMKVEQALLRIPELDSKIDISKFGNKPIGFLVDKIGEVLNIVDEKIEPPPQRDSNADSMYMEGIVKLKNQVLIILNPEQIITMN